MIEGPHRFREGAGTAANEARWYSAVRRMVRLLLRPLLLLSAWKLPRADERRDADTRQQEKVGN